jgi:hypothetical protein
MYTYRTQTDHGLLDFRTLNAAIESTNDDYIAVLESDVLKSWFWAKDIDNVWKSWRKDSYSNRSIKNVA